MEPCGTPDVTGSQYKKAPSRTTRCCLFVFGREKTKRRLYVSFYLLPKWKGFSVLQAKARGFINHSPVQNNLSERV